MNFDRRSLLAGAGLLAAGGLAGARPAAGQAPAARTPAGPAKGGIPYGSAVMIENFRADPRLRDELLRWCEVWVPMNCLKWEQLRHAREGFDFVNADESVAFALKHGKQVRGHALLWGDALPPWAKSLASAREAERELVRHIETVLDRYRGKIGSWDVVNEVVAHDPKPGRPMRDTIWQRLLGDRHVEIAFRTAHRVDPKLELVINDYDLENPDERTAERRRAILAIIRRLQDQNIPVHGVGFQAHLYGERSIDRRALPALGRELGRLGVKTLVTELDVIDWRLAADPRRRDREAAELVKTFLEAMMEGQHPQSIVSWGLTDRYSWISEVFKRNDRLPNRPLPLDASYRAKPMMEAIQAVRAAGVTRG